MSEQEVKAFTELELEWLLGVCADPPDDARLAGLMLDKTPAMIAEIRRLRQAFRLRDEEIGRLQYYEREYQAVSFDVGSLGEALGHLRIARPESPSTLMRRWIAEVARMRQEANR